jgi:adenylate cyclase
MLTFVTDRPHGFSEDELADLACRAAPFDHRRPAQSVVDHPQFAVRVSLGANTAPKVLTGQIRRGTGMELTAVLLTRLYCARWTCA